jgi:hypothetical protein
MKHLLPHGRGVSLNAGGRGVPTVPVHSEVFARLAKATALAEGRPTLRNVFVPQPVVGVPAEGLRGYIEGTDPVAKRPFMQGVIEALTKPLSDDDFKGATFERSTLRLLESDTEENLHELFIRNRWTDFLPVVLPTEERVERMLKGTRQPRDKIVGRLRPTAFREFWEFNVEKVAVNAVMAGARPDYFPIILAMASSGITARSSSTTSFATLSIVNGPIREEIGMNDGMGALGPYNHANTTIGRAFGLLSQNLQGGSVPGETYKGSLGNPLAYTFCFAEAEERSPWPPFHVDKGFKATASTVSIFLRRLVHPIGLWAARNLAGQVRSLPDRVRAISAAADCDGPARGAGLRRARLYQTVSDRVVRRACQVARPRLLGRFRDANADPSPRRRRDRTVCEPPEGGAGRTCQSVHT